MYKIFKYNRFYYYICYCLFNNFKWYFFFFSFNYINFISKCNLKNEKEIKRKLENEILKNKISTYEYNIYDKIHFAKIFFSQYIDLSMIVKNVDVER